MANNAQVTGKKEFYQRMRGYVKAVSTVKEQQQVLRAGGVVVRNKAKRMIEPAEKSVFYYRGGKKAEIKPGNLANSMYVFREKTGDVSIGPRVLNRINNGDVLGETPKKSSGYYAAQLYGSAIAFRKQVTEPALSASFGKMIQAMDRAYNRIHKKWAKRYNL